MQQCGGHRWSGGEKSTEGKGGRISEAGGFLSWVSEETPIGEKRIERKKSALNASANQREKPLSGAKGQQLGQRRPERDA